MELNQSNLTLGAELTVRTFAGRDGRTIGKLEDGCVVLFDQKNQYFDMIVPNMTVEGNVIVISENYIIISPTKRPELGENIAYVHYPEIDVSDIQDELKELVKAVKGNAKIMPRALLRILKLQQLTIRILTEAA